jgi:hypothetical protein
MANHPSAISVPSVKTNVNVAGNGSSPRCKELRDMRVRLA